MRKIIALLLALMMALSLAACGGGDSEKTPSSDNKTPSSTQQQEQNIPDADPVEDEPDNDGSGNVGSDKTESNDETIPTTGTPLDWPDNEYTKLVPTPDTGGKVISSGENGTLFAIELKWSKDQGLAYAKQLQDAGFGDDCVEKYENSGYIKCTANGVTIELMDVFGTAGLNITKAGE